MKSRNKKRLLALVLCMVVAISNSSFIFASETGQTEYPQEAEVQTQDEAVANDMDVAAYAADEGQAVAEEQTAPVEQVTAEPVAEPETTVAAPAEQPTAETPAAEQPTTEAPAAETPAAQEPATVSEGTTTTSENTNAAVGEAQTPQGEENGETVTYNQKMDLKQDFTDELGNVIATVSAEIPEGAFQVGESSQITMEVNTLTDAEKTQLENLMKEKIPAEKELGQYVAYNIRFKVDGTETESLQPIKITMTGDKTQIDDVENATVFYLDPADPTVTGDKEELEEIVQRVALVKQLQEAGQSIENIDKDYDLSDIELNEDGTASRIQMEGRQSTIYGCYVENTPEQEDPGEDDSTVQDPSEETPDPTTYAADTTNNTLTLNEDNGKLTASYTADNTEEYGYVWYRSINGGAFEAQEPTTYTSSTGNNLGSDIKADGSELYIALNGGALGYKENGVTNENVQYKVAIFKKSDIKNNGLPENGATAVVESRVYSVTSYYEVRNGGFETPNVQDKNTESIQYNHYQYSNTEYASSGGVWQTTGTGSGDHKDHDIEIINTKDGKFKEPYKWYGNDGAAEGNQFAELNCEAAGALYQDVLTTPGETLNYQLSHRARGSNKDDNSEEDTMYVLIMSTELAKQYDVTTEAKAQDIVNHPENYSGATVVSYTDDDQKWTTHQGVYNVPANSNQYLTRFFFVAGTTASGSNTVGNFLDNIKLTRDKLTPVEGTANVTLEKVIVGLKYAEARSLAEKLTFTVGSHTLGYSDLNWTWSGTADSYGTYTGTTILNISQNEFNKKLTLREQATSGNSLEVTGYNRSTSLFIDGNNTGNSESGTVEISNKDAKTVSFRNIYSLKSGGGGNQDDNKALSHEKYIKRNGDGTYDITLNVSGTVGTETKKAKVDIVLVMDVSSSMKGKNITKSKEAVEKLVKAFNQKTTVDAKYKLITFGTTAAIKTAQWTSGDAVNKIVNGDPQKWNDKGITIIDGQATNYQQGLKLAADVVKQPSSSEAKKIVIFLTDGKPTCYGSDGTGLGSATSVNTLNGALTAAEEINCDQFYAVGINLEDSIPVYGSDNSDEVFRFDPRRWEWVEIMEPDFSTSGEQILKDIQTKTGADGNAWNLSDVSQLPDKFATIAGKITTIACENVVITDKLSRYVDVTENSKLRVKIAVKNQDGTYTAKLDQQFPLTGGSVTLNGGKEAGASYDAATKTAKLTFDPSYQLEQDYYYYITITNVTPTEEAFKAYEKSGYNAVGDTPTDESKDGYYAVSEEETASGKITSSGKRGFPSNERASVNYKYKGVQQPEEKYGDPVIQVEQINVVKKWAGVEANDIKNQTILVQLIDKNGKPVDGKILKLTSQNNFTGSFTVEETNNYSGVRELVPDENGEITYEKNKYSMVENNGITTIDGNSYEVTYSKFEKGKQTITNTRNTEKIKVIKTGTNTELKLKGAEFTLKDSEGKLIKIGSNTTGTYISGDTGLVLEGSLKHGTYTLKEVKAPQGYLILPEEITITVSDKGVTVTGPNGKVTCEKDEDEVYVINVQNEVLYDLPSTGHSGIFNILMSGILLMFAGILIIYKMKGKEVLKK